MGPRSTGNPPRVVRTEGGGPAVPTGSWRERAGRQSVYSKSTGYLSLCHPEAPGQEALEDFWS